MKNLKDKIVEDLEWTKDLSKSIDYQDLTKTNSRLTKNKAHSKYQNFSEALNFMKQFDSKIKNSSNQQNTRKPTNMFQNAQKGMSLNNDNFYNNKKNNNYKCTDNPPVQKIFNKEIGLFDRDLDISPINKYCKTDTKEKQKQSFRDVAEVRENLLAKLENFEISEFSRTNAHFSREDEQKYYNKFEKNIQLKNNNILTKSQGSRHLSYANGPYKMDIKPMLGKIKEIQENHLDTPFNTKLNNITQKRKNFESVNFEKFTNLNLQKIHYMESLNTKDKDNKHQYSQFKTNNVDDWNNHNENDNNKNNKIKNDFDDNIDKKAFELRNPQRNNLIYKSICFKDNYNNINNINTKNIFPDLNSNKASNPLEEQKNHDIDFSELNNYHNDSNSNSHIENINCNPNFKENKISILENNNNINNNMNKNNLNTSADYTSSNCIANNPQYNSIKKKSNIIYSKNGEPSSTACKSKETRNNPNNNQLKISIIESKNSDSNISNGLKPVNLNNELEKIDPLKSSSRYNYTHSNNNSNSNYNSNCDSNNLSKDKEIDLKLVNKESSSSLLLNGKVPNRNLKSERVVISKVQAAKGSTFRVDNKIKTNKSTLCNNIKGENNSKQVLLTEFNTNTLPDNNTNNNSMSHNNSANTSKNNIPKNNIKSSIFNNNILTESSNISNQKNNFLNNNNNLLNNFNSYIFKEREKATNDNNICNNNIQNNNIININNNNINNVNNINNNFLNNKDKSLSLNSSLNKSNIANDYLNGAGTINGIGSTSLNFDSEKIGEINNNINQSKVNNNPDQSGNSICNCDNINNNILAIKPNTDKKLSLKNSSLINNKNTNPEISHIEENLNNLNLNIHSSSKNISISNNNYNYNNNNNNFNITDTYNNLTYSKNNITSFNNNNNNYTNLTYSKNNTTNKKLNQNNISSLNNNKNNKNSSNKKNNINITDINHNLSYSNNDITNININNITNVNATTYHNNSKNNNLNNNNFNNYSTNHQLQQLTYSNIKNATIKSKKNINNDSETKIMGEDILEDLDEIKDLEVNNIKLAKSHKFPRNIHKRKYSERKVAVSDIDLSSMRESYYTSKVLTLNNSSYMNPMIESLNRKKFFRKFQNKNLQTNILILESENSYDNNLLSNSISMISKKNAASNYEKLDKVKINKRKNSKYLVSSFLSSFHNNYNNISSQRIKRAFFNINNNNDNCLLSNTNNLEFNSFMTVQNKNNIFHTNMINQLTNNINLNSEKNSKSFYCTINDSISKILLKNKSNKDNKNINDIVTFIDDNNLNNSLGNANISINNAFANANENKFIRHKKEASLFNNTIANTQFNIFNSFNPNCNLDCSNANVNNKDNESSKVLINPLDENTNYNNSDFIEKDLNEKNFTENLLTEKHLKYFDLLTSSERDQLFACQDANKKADETYPDLGYKNSAFTLNNNSNKIILKTNTQKEALQPGYEKNITAEVSQARNSPDSILNEKFKEKNNNTNARNAQNRQNTNNNLKLSNYKKVKNNEILEISNFLNFDYNLVNQDDSKKSSSREMEDNQIKIERLSQHSYTNLPNFKVFNSNIANNMSNGLKINSIHPCMKNDSNAEKIHKKYNYANTQDSDNLYDCNKSASQENSEYKNQIENFDLSGLPLEYTNGDNLIKKQSKNNNSQNINKNKNKNKNVNTEYDHCDYDNNLSSKNKNNKKIIYQNTQNNNKTTNTDHKFNATHKDPGLKIKPSNKDQNALTSNNANINANKTSKASKQANNNNNKSKPTSNLSTQRNYSQNENFMNTKRIRPDCASPVEAANSNVCIDLYNTNVNAIKQNKYPNHEGSKNISNQCINISLNLKGQKEASEYRPQEPKHRSSEKIANVKRDSEEVIDLISLKSSVEIKNTCNKNTSESNVKKYNKPNYNDIAINLNDEEITSNTISDDNKINNKNNSSAEKHMTMQLKPINGKSAEEPYIALANEVQVFSPIENHIEDEEQEKVKNNLKANDYNKSLHLYNKNYDKDFNSNEAKESRKENVLCASSENMYKTPEKTDTISSEADLKSKIKIKIRQQNRLNTNSILKHARLAQYYIPSKKLSLSCEASQKAEIRQFLENCQFSIHNNIYDLDFINNLLEKENKFRPDANYLASHEDLTAEHRAILVDWLMEICEDLAFKRDTFHFAVNYFDRFLSRTEHIQKNILQLIGVACLSIAGKFEVITTHAFFTLYIYI